jgi:hypothetical protein
MTRAEDLPVTINMNLNMIHLINLPNISPKYPGPSSRLLPCTFSSLLEHCLGLSQAPPGGHQKSTLNLHRDDSCDRETVEEWKGKGRGEKTLSDRTHLFQPRISLLLP